MQTFLNRKATLAVSLIFFPPLGIALLWLTDLDKTKKITFSAISAAFLAIAMLTSTHETVTGDGSLGLASENAKQSQEQPIHSNQAELDAAVDQAKPLAERGSGSIKDNSSAIRRTATLTKNYASESYPNLPGIVIEDTVEKLVIEFSLVTKCGDTAPVENWIRKSRITINWSDRTWNETMVSELGCLGDTSESPDWGGGSFDIPTPNHLTLDYLDDDGSLIKKGRYQIVVN